jgi:ubiquitin-activating enzyme E1
LVDISCDSLLCTLIADSTVSPGQLFWSGLKRQPRPLTFDRSDKLHVSFVAAAANLRAAVFGLEGCRDLKVC